MWGGLGEFNVTGWEYLTAKELGLLGKHEILTVETPTKIGNFKPYVDHFYGKKAQAEQTGNKSARLIAKIMLNSLYGKFAQRNDRFRDFYFMPIDEPLQAGFTIEAEFDDARLAVWSKPSEGGRIFNVATAASITGFVRSMLMRAIVETDPYYCDTDSIICDSSRIPSGIRDSLGGWALESAGDRLLIAGKKLYGMRSEGKWKIASKGCRIDHEQLEKICAGETIEYQSQAPCYSLLSSPHFITRKIKQTQKPC
jgi:hypothetical protein